jgi:hypothetical protein
MDAEIIMEPSRQAAPREPNLGIDKILRFARAQREQGVLLPGRDEVTKETGQAALDLVHQVAAVIRANEARTETVVQRAIEELRSAEARIKALEARALAAETRASEAEKWLMRLHEAIQDKLADWSGKGQRGAPPRHMAA